MAHGDPPPNGSSLSVSAWGATLRANGTTIVLLLAISANIAVSVLGFRDLADARKAQIAEHQAIINAQNNLACVLLLSEKERVEFRGDPSAACNWLVVVRGAWDRLNERRSP